MNQKEFQQRFDAAYARALDQNFIEGVSKQISESNDTTTAMFQALLNVHERVLRAELEEFLVTSEE